MMTAYNGYISTCENTLKYLDAQGHSHREHPDATAH